MKRLFSILKNRRTQYVLIIWILLLKAVEITTNLLSEVELMPFFSVLGFSNLSETPLAIWNTLFIATVFWLIYRLSRDVLQISFAPKPLSKKEMLSLAILLTWAISVVATSLQFASLVTMPLANPALEVSRYYAPFRMENGDSSLYVKLNNLEGNKVALDLSKSIFADPFSVYMSGETSQYATNVGTSYFTVRNSSLGQKMIEMRFCGNGSDKIGGWFAYRLALQDPLQISENATLMLLLKLTPSSDETAWTYIKIDFLSKEDKTYALTWKFHDVSMNYVFSSHNGTRNNYLLGRATDWVFYQFDLNAIFYTSFSRNPRCITSIEYGIGAEADNDIAVQFLVAKISQQPLEINEMRIENVKPTIKLKDDHSIRLSGLSTIKLFVIVTPNIAEKNVSTQWSIIKVSRTESYKWNTSGFTNMTEMKVCFVVISNSTKLLLNDNEILPNPQNQRQSYEINIEESQVVLVVANATDIYLMPVVVISSILAFLLCLVIRKVPSNQHRHV